jgi:hypothetical protein
VSSSVQPLFIIVSCVLNFVFEDQGVRAFIFFVVVPGCLVAGYPSLMQQGLSSSFFCAFPLVCGGTNSIPSSTFPFVEDHTQVPLKPRKGCLRCRVAQFHSFRARIALLPNPTKTGYGFEGASPFFDDESFSRARMTTMWALRTHVSKIVTVSRCMMMSFHDS